MDAQEILQQLTASLRQGIQQLAEKRDNCNSGTKYAELTGRIDTMTTIINFIQQGAQAVTTPPKEPKGKAKGKKAKKTEEDK